MNFVKTVKNYFVGSPDEGTPMQMSPTLNYKAPKVDPQAKKSSVVIAPSQQGGEMLVVVSKP